MKKKLNKKAKILIGILILLLAIGITIVLLPKKEKSKPIPKEPKKEEKVEQVDIIDINSKTRPLAITVNNTPLAVKVQTGLNKAYIS